ncbi:MAG TPA: hypothetical protein VII81_04630, partial [Terriglobales bacterium]
FGDLRSAHHHHGVIGEQADNTAQAHVRGGGFAFDFGGDNGIIGDRRLITNTFPRDSGRGGFRH